MGRSGRRGREMGKGDGEEERCGWSMLESQR
jgi:hypothetical protein